MEPNPRIGARLEQMLSPHPRNGDSLYETFPRLGVMSPVASTLSHDLARDMRMSIDIFLVLANALTFKRRAGLF